MYLNKVLRNILWTYSTVFKKKSVSNTSLFSKYCQKHIQHGKINEEAYIKQKENIDKYRTNINKYTERSYTCGDLRINNVGEKIILCGWLEYQRLKRFIVLRDGYGETQLIIRENDFYLQDLFSNLSYESIIKVEGVVVTRPKDMINIKQSTGTVEVLVDRAEILNKANDNLPFTLREFQKPNESLRMKFRYLDLRFPQMQFNLRTRSIMLMKIREFLIQAGFVDVETPTLFKATPGGAQEFVVPTRFPGQFYSLVQSPQQFKQMLMAGSIDRYFQIARCYRDEGSRPDRQPEFTQLDIEMSFTNKNGVLKVVEDLLQYSWPDFHDLLPSTFKKITYKHAMEKYGTDKPDIRFGFEIQNITEILKPVSKFIEEDFYSGCLVMDDKFNYSASTKDKLKKIAKDFPNAIFIQSIIKNKINWLGRMRSLFNDDIISNLYESCNLKEGNIIFLAYGPKNETLSLLGKIRLEYVNLLEEEGNKIRKEGMHMLWITDFPLFELNNNTGGLMAVHHPFTSPHPDDAHLLDTSPLNIRSLAYDLVLNGNEIGGGSIRIHNSNLQEKIFSLLNIEKTKMQYILDMLASGCPPHGGIALGLDRLLSIVIGTQSIRDVIAFPKTFEGRDPISGAPSEITEKDKQIYHINSIF